ncbi:restriction endonuclease subunit S [Acinetobacter lactucae]|uniref:restriction endonuclease subunit S n=1 Tax=Acinetobacter lactucae TaxID=1785128 RepID=UPI0015F4A13B|nr:restriction endonuclease subunit S [Acinetobacter lactucae]
MSTDLNMEYQEVKFGEIAKHISKRVEPSETTLEIYVGLEHIDPDSLKITRHGVPSDVAGQKLLVKKGQIIFGKRRAYQRKVAVADWDCICSAHAMVLEAIPGKILPEFLPFFMQSNQFMERAVEISEGSLSPTIKWKRLEEQLFKIPALSKQETIVELLLHIESTLDKANYAKDSYSKLQSIYANKILKGEVRLPKYATTKWKEYKLKDLGQFFGGLTYSPTDVVQDATKLLVLRSSNIQDGELVLNDNVYVDNSSLKKTLVKKNDILICVRNGSKHLIGKTAIIDDDIHATHGAFMSLYRSKDYRYINQLFQSDRYKYLVSQNLGATINSINGKDLENFKFLMPESDEREEISQILEKYARGLSLLKVKCEKIQIIKMKMLDSYLG